MPEYPLTCANTKCGRLYRVFETVVFYTQRTEQAMRDTTYLIAKSLATDIAPVDRSIARTALVRRAKGADKVLADLNDGAIDAVTAERILSDAVQSLQFMCPHCHSLFGYRAFPPDSAPAVKRESGTWPEDAPSALAGKHFHSKDERLQQVATLTPHLVPREDHAAISEKKRRPRQPADPTPTPADAAPVATRAKPPAAAIESFFANNPGVHSADHVAEQTGLERDVVLGVFRTGPYARAFGAKYRCMKAAGTQEQSAQAS